MSTRPTGVESSTTWREYIKEREAKLSRELIELHDERWEYVTECNMPNDLQVRFIDVQDAYDRLFPKEADE